MVKGFLQATDPVNYEQSHAGDVATVMFLMLSEFYLSNNDVATSALTYVWQDIVTAINAKVTPAPNITMNAQWSGTTSLDVIANSIDAIINP